MQAIVEAIVGTVELKLTEGEPLFSVAVQVGMEDEGEVRRVIAETMDDCGLDFNSVRLDDQPPCRGTLATIIGVSRKGVLPDTYYETLAGLASDAGELHTGRYTIAEDLPAAA